MIKKHLLGIFFGFLSFDPLNAQGINEILNQSNRILRGERPQDIRNETNAEKDRQDRQTYLERAFFKKSSDFSVFYSAFNIDERMERSELERLSASMELLVIENGGVFLDPGKARSGDCRGVVRWYGGNLIRSLIIVKRGEMSNSPPTFFKEAESRDKQMLVSHLTGLKEGMSKGIRDLEACRRNIDTIDKIVIDLNEIANRENEKVRDQLKLNHQRRVAEEAERRRVAEAESLRRTEEQKQEQRRLEEARRAQVAKEIEAERKAIEERQKSEAEKKAKRIGG